MRAVVQRVVRAEARLISSQEVLGRIDLGLLVLLGIRNGDTPADAAWLADKITGLRIFPAPAPEKGEGASAENERGANAPMSCSLADLAGGLLVVSQFTLYGDCRKGRRPSFTDAMPPGDAEVLYEHFVDLCKRDGLRVATGRFGAMMDIDLINWGPVTLLIDSPERRGRGPDRGDGR